jgi:hypothetical protein
MLQKRDAGKDRGIALLKHTHIRRKEMINFLAGLTAWAVMMSILVIVLGLPILKYMPLV